MKEEKLSYTLFGKIDIIIPTWNSMPELEKTLKSLKIAFPSDIINNVIVVDKHSEDGTIECAKKYGCVVLFDDKSLGSARLAGLKRATTDWVAFIDSDIELPPNWFEKMITSLFNRYLVSGQSAIEQRVGWFYGRTIDDVSPLREEKLYKMELELSPSGRLVTHRAYTNNTICRRKPLLDAPIEDLNAWEDYVMTQTMLKAGYEVVEFPVTCIHLRSSTYDKFGVMTEAWGIAGELKAKGWNIRTCLRPFWFIYWGVRCTIHFRDFEHLWFNLKSFWSQIKALYINRKKSFEWKRSE